MARVWFFASTMFVLGAASCAASDETLSAGSFQPMDDDDFPGNCGGTGTDTDGCDTDGTGTPTLTSGTTSSEPGCRGSTDCMGGSCVAPYDSQTREVGAFECRFVCVPTLDEESWCADDDSCCSETAVCSARGYCIEPEGSTTTSAGSTTGSDGSTTTGDAGSTGGGT